MAHSNSEGNPSEDGNGNPQGPRGSDERRDSVDVREPVIEDDSSSAITIVDGVPIQIETIPVPSVRAEPRRKERVPLRFSPPTTTEKAEIAFNWAASFTPTGRIEAVTHRQRAVSIGSAARYVNRTFLLDAIANQCREIVCRTSTTLVKASLRDVDEILGWICYDERAIHYVYVTERARHEGIGTQLLELVGDRLTALGGESIPMSCMTAGGAALLNSIPRKWWLPTR